MRKSESQLPEVRDKENNREVRRNILGLEQCVYAREGKTGGERSICIIRAWTHNTDTELLHTHTVSFNSVTKVH